MEKLLLRPLLFKVKKQLAEKQQYLMLQVEVLNIKMQSYTRKK
jgi:hypothetical protein